VRTSIKIKKNLRKTASDIDSNVTEFIVHAYPIKIPHFV
jgi:hypothetical protein